MNDPAITYDDLRRVRQRAQQQVDAANEAIVGAVALAAGRLRLAGCDRWDLAKLKAELQDFNSVTRSWKDQR